MTQLSTVWDYRLCDKVIGTFVGCIIGKEPPTDIWIKICLEKGGGHHGLPGIVYLTPSPECIASLRTDHSEFVSNMQIKIRNEILLRAMKTFIRRKVGHTTQFRLKKPHQWPCNHPASKARGNILQFCEFQTGSRVSLILQNYSGGTFGHFLNFGWQLKPRIIAVNAFLFYTFIFLRKAQKF